MTAYVDDICEFWMLHDMTERLLTEEKFRILFEHSSAAYFLFGADGVLDCNLAAVKQLGFKDKSEAVGRSFISMSPEVQADGTYPLKSSTM